jgi:hypothetical protein
MYALIKATVAFAIGVAMLVPLAVEMMFQARKNRSQLLIL